MYDFYSKKKKIKQLRKVKERKKVSIEIGLGKEVMVWGRGSNREVYLKLKIEMEIYILKRIRNIVIIRQRRMLRKKYREIYI